MRFLFSASLIAMAISFALSLGAALSACASTDDSSVSNSSDGIPYDQLVDRLNAQTRAKVTAPATTDFLDHAKIHTGVAFTNSIYSLQLPNGSSVGMSQTGFEVSLGLDMLSDNWAGEVAFLNLGQASIQNVQVSASEFDLRFFLPRSSSKQLGLPRGCRPWFTRLSPDLY